jgi:hypothetical protein
MNNMHRNIKKISKGKAHWRNMIRIEITTIKLQNNQGRILSTGVYFRIKQDHKN